jgi:hypothetical protein
MSLRDNEGVELSDLKTVWNCKCQVVLQDDYASTELAKEHSSGGSVMENEKYHQKFSISRK